MQELGILHTFKMHKGKKEWQKKNITIRDELNKVGKHKVTKIWRKETTLTHIGQTA